MQTVYVEDTDVFPMLSSRPSQSVRAGENDTTPLSKPVQCKILVAGICSLANTIHVRYNAAHGVVSLNETSIHSE